MIRRPPSSTRTDTLLPDTTLCRSGSPEKTVDQIAMSAVDGDSVEASGLSICGAASISSDDVCNLVFGHRRRGHGHALKIFRRSEEHTSELQSLMRISYADFCLKTKTQTNIHHAMHQDKA